MGMLSTDTVRRLNRPAPILSSRTRRTEASSRSGLIRPESPAASIAARAQLRSAGMSSMSLPARNARTALSPGPNRLMMAPMGRGTLPPRPQNPPPRALAGPDPADEGPQGGPIRPHQPPDPQRAPQESGGWW